eukprot:TRINITY_DN1175_c1_g4_i1.p1 TRINITY_DN1175_c1_g4~~TRINITY_DN1175_c1_g4_i1.p1  ORF type:complete len:183 (+),score=36.01 TRINITY_DN1175_c1_g4_i1:67-615(+)
MSALLRRSRVLLAEVPQWESSEPKWKQEQRPGNPFLRPDPWQMSDEGRDASKKYTMEEMQERYGEAPHPNPTDDGYLPVDKVPDLYKFGQEGDKIPGLVIMKDQQTPVIRKLEDYPGIWYFLDGHNTHRAIQDWEKQAETGNMLPWDNTFRRHKLHFRLRYKAIAMSYGPAGPKKSKTKRGK